MYCTIITSFAGLQLIYRTTQTAYEATTSIQNGTNDYLQAYNLYTKQYY